ncbi:hypothetical protein ACS0TY_001249 [Phlomoides rotata]
MDPIPDPSSRRKMKFAPKAPSRRNPKPTVTTPVKDAEDDPDDIQLLRRFSRQTRREPKVEKKSAEEVLFSHGVASTDDQSERASSSRQKERKDDQMQPRFTVSTAGTGVGEGSGNSTIAVAEKKKKEYREPWDYNDSYYPTTLPLRRPYSGNPDILNKAEFEEAPKHNEDDDLPPAIELGLMDEDDNPQLLFFKFPSKLPLGTLTRRETNDQSKAPEKSLKGKGIAGLNLNSSVSGTKGKETGAKEVCSVEELPKGYMGKMLVYKSGAVKLKLGDVLFDVSAGIDCHCPQTAMSINTMTGDCCELGDVTKMAVVIPNLDHLDASDD